MTNQKLHSRTFKFKKKTEQFSCTVQPYGQGFFNNLGLEIRIQNYKKLFIDTVDLDVLVGRR